MATVKLLTYDVYRQGMTLFKDLADQTYQDIEHLPSYYLWKVADSEVPTGYDSAYRLLMTIKDDPESPHPMGDMIGIIGSEGGGIIQTYIVGSTPLASDWLSDQAGGPPLIPSNMFLYLVLTPGDYLNSFYRYDEVAETYILVNSSDLVFSYIVGSTPYASNWLSLTAGGTPLTPVNNKFYIILSAGDYQNYIFRFDSGLNAYVMLSGGGAGGAIFTYIVGNTPYAANWLSESVGGSPLTPKDGLLYLVLTAGPYYSALYRYDETNHVYILVGNARVQDITKAEYLNLPVSKQNDGTIYFITDSASTSPTADDYLPSRATMPSNPATGSIILWKGATSGDFDVSPAIYKYDGTHWVRQDMGIEGQTIQIDTIPNIDDSMVGRVYQYVGPDSGDFFIHGHFYEACSDGDPDNPAYWWTTVNVEDSVQLENPPAADYAHLGKIFQFIGTDFLQFVKGHFYICQPATGGGYEWVELPVETEETVEMSLEDFDDLTPAEQNNGQAYFIPDAQPESKFVAHTGFTPIGTVISVMGTTAPKHYLACDGTVYQISHYPELALYFKQQFGSENYFGGDGTATFAVPDLRGEFLRGTGTNSHTDQGSGANVGVHQDSTEVPIIFGASDSGSPMIRGPKGNTAKNGDAASSTTTKNYYGPSSGSTYTGTHSSTVSSAFTVRPTNTSVLYCIAVRNIYIDAGYDYSETESVVGTWIDGKPIYQRTITDGLASTAPRSNTWGTVYTDTWISTIETIVYGVIMLNASSHNFTAFWYLYRANGNDLQIQSYIGGDTIRSITLQYTKTTD